MLTGNFLGKLRQEGTILVISQENRTFRWILALVWSPLSVNAWRCPLNHACDESHMEDALVNALEMTMAALATIRLKLC